jgi:hypothetical protein
MTMSHDRLSSLGGSVGRAGFNSASRAASVALSVRFDPDS